MKKITYRLLLLITIVIFGQIFVAKYIIPVIPALTMGMPGIGKLDTFLNLNDRYRTLYFGDSIVKSFAETDSDKSSIPEMLAKVYPSLKIGDMSSPAYHLGVFEAMFEYISMSSNKPVSVIIPINLRSFSPQWDMRPEYQFGNEIFFLTHNKFIFYFGKPISVFRAINVETIDEETFRKTPVFFGQREVGTAGQFEDEARSINPSFENIKNMYIYDYMYQLDKGHRKLESMNKLMNTAKKNNIKIYVYITPIDYKDGVKYVGADFLRQTRSNADLICSMITNGGFPCLNLAFALGSENFAFTHPGLPNEHLDDIGRMTVAQKLKKLIESN